MRLKNIPGALETVEASDWVLTEPEKYCGRWQSVFPQPAPLHVEIGMGKGSFLMGMAQAHTEENFLGIEKYASVLVKAVKKQEERRLPNLRFILMDAKNLAGVFGEDEIERIYLNFPDPWPKGRHAGRRLTSGNFLKLYEHVMRNSGQLELKTDNRDLFDYSLQTAQEQGWDLAAATADLHHSALAEGNIMTEYEAKFAAAGSPICKMVIINRRKEI